MARPNTEEASQHSHAGVTKGSATGRRVQRCKGAGSVHDRPRPLGSFQRRLMGKPRADPLGFLIKLRQPLPVNALFLNKLLTSSWALAGSECLTTVKKSQHKITVQDASVTCPTKPQKLDMCFCTAKGNGHRSGPSGRWCMKSGQTHMAPTTATNTMASRGVCFPFLRLGAPLI